MSHVGFIHSTCVGQVTTLAGSAQGYKDGIGENAKFHHTSGEEYNEAGIKFCYLFKNAKLAFERLSCQSGVKQGRKAAKSSILKSDNSLSHKIKLIASVKFVTLHLDLVVLYHSHLHRF